MRIILMTLALWHLPLASMELQPFGPSSLLQESQREVSEREIGLSALQKFGGVWRYRDSERLSGELHRSTWQIDPGHSASEAFDWLAQQLSGAELLYECAGRSCGRSVQWANKVFEQRLLYGPDNNQRYAVYRLQGDSGEYRYILYAIERSADRQYLHLDTLRLAGEAQQ